MLDNKMLDNKMLERVMEAATHEAVDFFHLRGEWDIGLSIDDGLDEDVREAAMWIEISYGYLRAVIHAYPPHIQSYEEAWGHVGHEVAHMVTRELAGLVDCGPNDKTRKAFVIALEQTTSRLERLFVRERPYPGDKKFKKGKKSGPA